MGMAIHQPHDHLFKRVFGAPAEAAHAFNREVREARQRMRPLLGDLEREGSVGQDDMKMFVRYMLETGPEDTPEEMGELLSRTAAGGEMMTSGERLRREGREEGRREGRLEGRREGRLETIDGFLRTGVDWSVIERATGIGEQEYRQLRSRPNGAAAAGGGGT